MRPRDKSVLCAWEALRSRFVPMFVTLMGVRWSEI